ncbi:small secreted hydrophilic protein [Nocardioides jensenii]|uniref:small secreted hydrophilic protein n=1 Tax=Nocardioides jensenii TaxID=1843 RepID=UPI000B2DF997|nr:small secreted hydrophilic protein [Nocardioides jensenii]
MGRWKVVLAAALALPMLAYVAGSLAAADDKPGDRSPIRIDEAPATSPGSTPGGTTEPSPTRTPGTKEKPDDDRPRTVTRVPNDLDDDDDDDGRNRGGRDDDDDDGDDDDD